MESTTSRRMQMPSKLFGLLLGAVVLMGFTCGNPADRRGVSFRWTVNAMHASDGCRPNTRFQIVLTEGHVVVAGDCASGMTDRQQLVRGTTAFVAQILEGGRTLARHSSTLTVSGEELQDIDIPFVIPTCRSDSDCETHRCREGLCIGWCERSLDCADGFVCSEDGTGSDGECILDPMIAFCEDTPHLCPPDAGPSPEDAGTPPHDAGTPEVDAGPTGSVAVRWTINGQPPSATSCFDTEGFGILTLRFTSDFMPGYGWSNCSEGVRETFDVPPGPHMFHVLLERGTHMFHEYDVPFTAPADGSSVEASLALQEVATFGATFTVNGSPFNCPAGRATMTIVATPSSGAPIESPSVACTGAPGVWAYVELPVETYAVALRFDDAEHPTAPILTPLSAPVEVRGIEPQLAPVVDITCPCCPGGTGCP